ncbi:hypothetical protein UVI_02054940 [Ustilaginoidea virens]|uniref:WLM domain-containing protein n=1 Tax=Ustilaginoidea virens TaxID=1159556 RepID=A0A1B5L6M5_USTVR|nr:hypothetical protein UVI_02054940 [Ustilaginoidea virens]
MSLEEYEPNREFVGRNFNAGEVVQLVLRSVQTGRWLPFNCVQMVMMHELAHCKQMNHSRAFWVVRNQFAAQMTDLWGEGYTGEGLWGRGANLTTGEWERNQVNSDEVLPEHLCGGTYRSPRRKRKAKTALTHQQRKERRVLKKFGVNGVALGADEDTKIKLEKGKRVKAKPRVAGSARGRELRAAAALARLEQQKDQEIDDGKKCKVEENATASESETGESQYEDDDVAETDRQDAIDLDGVTPLRDAKGRSMVRVCSDEDATNPDARDELIQLQDVFRARVKMESPVPETSLRPAVCVKQQEPSERSWQQPPATIGVKKEPKVEGPCPREKPAHSESRWSKSSETKLGHGGRAGSTPAQQLASSARSSSACSMCSFSNNILAVTCSMCANVLNPALWPDSWTCSTSSCRNSGYVNSDDCGVCGLCGQRR